MSRPTLGHHGLAQGARQPDVYPKTASSSTIRETLSAARAAVASNEAGRHGASTGRISLASSRWQGSQTSIAKGSGIQRGPVSDFLTSNKPLQPHLRPIIADTHSTVQPNGGLNAIRGDDRLHHVRQMPLFTVPDSSIGDEDSVNSLDPAALSEVFPSHPQRLSQVSLVKPSRPVTARISRSLANYSSIGASANASTPTAELANPTSSIEGSSEIDNEACEPIAQPTESMGKSAKAKVDETMTSNSTFSGASTQHLVDSLKKLFASVGAIPIPRPPSSVNKVLVPRPSSVRQGRPSSSPPPLGDDAVLSAPLPKVRETPRSTLASALPYVQNILERISNPSSPHDNDGASHDESQTTGDKVWISALSLILFGDLTHILINDRSALTKGVKHRVELLHKPMHALSQLCENDDVQSLDQFSSHTVFSLAHMALQQLLKTSLNGSHDSMISTCVPAIAHFLVASLVVAAGTERVTSPGFISTEEVEIKDSRVALPTPLPQSLVDVHTKLFIDAIQLLHNLTSSVVPRNRQSVAAPSIVAVLAALLEPTLWISKQNPIMDDKDELFSYLRSVSSAPEAIRLKPYMFSLCTPSHRDEVISKVLSLLRNLSRLRRSAMRPGSGSPLKATNSFDSDATLISFEGQGILTRLMTWQLLSCVCPMHFSSDIAFHCSRVLGRLSEIPSYVPRLGADPSLVLSILAILNRITNRIEAVCFEPLSQELQTLVRLLYVCGNITTTAQKYDCNGLLLNGYGEVLATQDSEQTHSWLMLTANLSLDKQKCTSGIYIFVHALNVFTKLLASQNQSDFVTLNSKVDSREERKLDSQVTLLAATTTKLIRLIANCALDPQVGLSLALMGRSELAEAKEFQGDVLSSYLTFEDSSGNNIPESLSRALEFCARCGIEALPELTLNIVACITNVSFYSSSFVNSSSSDSLAAPYEVAIPVYFQKYHPAFTLPSLVSILMVCANAVLSNEHDQPPSFYLELAIETARALGNASREKVHKAYLAISRVDEALLLLIQSERLIRIAPQILQAAGGVLINLTTNMYPSMTKSNDVSDFESSLVDSLLQLVKSDSSIIDSEDFVKDLSVNGGFVSMVSFRQDCFLIESAVQLIERCANEFLMIIRNWETSEVPHPIDTSFVQSIEAADLVCKVLFNLGCCTMKFDSGSETVLMLGAEKIKQKSSNGLILVDCLRIIASSFLRGVTGVYGEKLTMIIDRKNDKDVSGMEGWNDEAVNLCVQCEGALISLSTLLTQIWVSLSSKDSAKLLLPFEVSVSSDQELLSLNHVLEDDDVDTDADNGDDLEVLEAPIQELASFTIAPDYYVEDVDDDDEYD